MLACDFPWNDDSMKGLAYKIQYKEPAWKVLKDREVSAECLDLLKKLLTKDKGMRISLDDALEHIWFKTEHKKQGNISLSQTQKEVALYSLNSYGKVSKLFKAIKLLKIKLGSGIENVRDFRDLFLRFDH